MKVEHDIRAWIVPPDGGDVIALGEPHRLVIADGALTFHWPERPAPYRQFVVVITSALATWPKDGQPHETVHRTTVYADPDRDDLELSWRLDTVPVETR